MNEPLTPTDEPPTFTEKQLKAAIKFAASQGVFSATLHGNDKGEENSTDTKWKGSDSMCEAIQGLDEAFSDEGTSWTTVALLAEREADKAVEQTFGSKKKAGHNW